MELDDSVLDLPDRIDAADPGGMLRAVATSGAQVRTAVALTVDAAPQALARISAQDRPRAVLVAGVGGSGIVGGVLAALAAPVSPVPVLPYSGYGLPGWVGPLDLVVAVSCSGRTEETLSSAAEAVRRGTRLLAVGGSGSPLHELATEASAGFLPVDGGGRLPRANLWALATPALMAADALGLVRVPGEGLAAAADRLDADAERFGPATPTSANAAKQLALDLAGSFPVVWGSSEVAGVAAYRLVSQLAENAKYPGMHGTLPEVNHNQIVAVDGPLAGAAAGGDFFRDRVDDVGADVRLRLVLLRDGDEHPQVARRRSVSREIAERRGVPVSEVAAQGAHPLERLASLVAVGDYASVYLALVLGVDPTPIEPIEELKTRIASR